MTTMKFGLRDLRTVNAALSSAIDWEQSLAEANANIPVERKKCEEGVEKYRKLKMKVFSALNIKPVDPFKDAKVVTLDELRKSQEQGKPES